MIKVIICSSDFDIDLFANYFLSPLFFLSSVSQILDISPLPQFVCLLPAVLLGKVSVLKIKVEKTLMDRQTVVHSTDSVICINSM